MFKIELHKDAFGCQCALSETCKIFQKPTICNCDAKGMNLTDVGILSSELLPVYGLRYGGFYTPFSSVRFNIGPLICSGKEGFYPSEAEDMEKETLNSKINELKNDMQETKEELEELSDQLEDHLRTTTTTTTTTSTTTTTAVPIVIAKNKLMSALDYKDDYEVSFEFQALSVPKSGSGHHQIIVGKWITHLKYIIYYI